MDSDSRHQRILVTGGSGLIGRRLCRRLRRSDIEVVELAHRARHGAYAWNAEAGERPPAEALARISAVIHLAGAPIAQRWTAKAKRAIHDSRVKGTRALAEALAALPEAERPTVFISMSGVAIYGRRRDESLLDEQSPLAPDGDSFLADVARAWESAATPAAEAGIRTVHLRTGMVLARHGGALPKLVPAFKWFAGGPAGPGTQRMPWITLDDLHSLIFFCLRTRTLSGPVNAVAPHAVTNADFAHQLGLTLHRPAVVRTPAWALRLLFGQMAEETILADLAPFPAKAMEAGFQFTHNRIKDALADIFSGTAKPAA